MGNQRKSIILFVVPECSSTIKSYLDYRTKSGELLDNESYLDKGTI